MAGVCANGANNPTRTWLQAKGQQPQAINDALQEGRQKNQQSLEGWLFFPQSRLAQAFHMQLVHPLVAEAVFAEKRK